MPKIIELTVEIEIQKVSCPGVWLCQDGRVSLTVFALETSYQTCMLPPVFPLLFKDVFYFKKRFQDSCAINNICCLLKDETIYCELVQWTDDCEMTSDVLAQYLGNIGDVLFPPNMCSNEGVDLLMRRSKEFPGILSPKIEIATKVRIDEVWNCKNNSVSTVKAKLCKCPATNDTDTARQKQVCHSAQYHRIKCTTKSPTSRSRSRSGSRSCANLQIHDIELKKAGCCCGSSQTSQTCVPDTHRSRSRGRQYNVYNVETPEVDSVWRDVTSRNYNKFNHSSNREPVISKSKGKDCDNLLDQCEEGLSKMLLESQYVDVGHERCPRTPQIKRHQRIKFTPCVCEICKKYYELFHSNS